MATQVFLALWITFLRKPQGSEKEGVLQGGGYEQRFGMHFNEFKLITDNFKLRIYNPPGVNREQWHEVFELVEEFNSNVVKSFNPGKAMVADEIMSAWKGVNLQINALGMPHQTKIIRKPEGVGAECKALADGETGIIIQLDILEVKEAMSQKEFQQEYGAGCAVILRMMKPWRNTHRVVIADSAFASMKTLMALWCLYKTFFIGIVKTATIHYPIRLLKDWFAVEERRRLNDRTITRGQWHVLTSTFRNRFPNRNMLAFDGDYPVMALCWADKKAKTIIANWGSTLRCSDDSVRLRSRTEVDDSGHYITIHENRSVMQPEVIDFMFRYFGLIDFHDGKRQGTLEIERFWLTQKWWLRFFQTILGVIIVSAYLAYRHEYRSQHYDDMTECLDFLDCVNILCKELIVVNNERILRQNHRHTDAIDEVC